MNQINHLDLFSGIGGFALAASRVWTNHKVVSFCEIDKFCQKVLQKHWPDVPIIDDIKKIKGSDFETVDLITGGFPCQPFSAAGKQRGTKDDRYLWPEMFRIIQELLPTWVVAENVGGIQSIYQFDCESNLEGKEYQSKKEAKKNFDEIYKREGEGVLWMVLEGLEQIGYEVQSIIIPACAVNAPHRRDRVWIVAHRNSIRQPKLSQRIRTPSTRRTKLTRRSKKSTPDTKSSNSRKQKSKNHTTRQTFIRRKSKVRTESIRHNENAPNTGCKHREQGRDEGMETDQTKRTQGLPNSKRCNKNIRQQSQQEGWNKSWIEVATRFCGVDDGLSRKVDRAARLKALGNAIVPQVAEQLFRAIKNYPKN